MGTEKNLVFVSYAHKDKAFLDNEVLPFLGYLELRELIRLWDDRLIGTGDDWYTEIADKLDQAKVAVLLITPNFLASKFCLYEELPVLLQRARRGELRVLPLYADPCFWENEHWLRRTQMWPTDGKALSQRRPPTRKALLSEFARIILEAVQSPTISAEKEIHFDKPHPTHDIHRMPQTGSLLFGRAKELKLLDKAWENGTNLVAFTAGGGVGKSTLIRVWAEQLAEGSWQGCERVFAWSFYSQGTGRMTDSEAFISEALSWFGEKDFLGLSIWDRAELLVDLIRKQRTLLILDGVEPLQSGEVGIDRGRVRDPGLRTLLEELATENKGLCVVTTRERLADLNVFEEPDVLHQDLDQVSPLAGRALLRLMRIKGDDTELESAVEDLGRHALAVSLLGRFLANSSSPHIAGVKQLPGLKHSAEAGGHPRRVLEVWSNRLVRSPELELMHLVGLFDRPAAVEAIEAVIRGEQIWGATKQLKDVDLEEVIENLRRAGLLAKASTHTSDLDTHPVIREYFGEQLKAATKKGWREAHHRLYTYYQEVAVEYPENLAEMQPLFAAVVHGCSAGQKKTVFEEIFKDRICRGSEAYIVYKLGAYAAALSCLAHFFDQPWSRPDAVLKKLDQSELIGNAAFALRAIGRLDDATEAFKEALRQGIEAKDWKNAATRAGNLSALYEVLGRLEQEKVLAEEAIYYADKSGDPFERIARRTQLAWAKHQLGQRKGVRSLFMEAEQIQMAWQPEYPILRSLQGFRYCQLLLDLGEAEKVLQRGEKALNLAIQSGRRTLDIGLDRVSLGLACMALATPDLDGAGKHLRKALDDLRAGGGVDDLPHGFLARATYFRLRGEYDLAKRDLERVEKIVWRTGMRLFVAELALENTRLCLAKGNQEIAKTSLDMAKALVQEMSYGRRLRDIEELESQL